MSSLFDTISASKKQPVEAIAIELHERLPWLMQPGFKIGKHEGYRHRIFGARAGLVEDICTRNVLHEVSHAVELTLLAPRIWKRRIKNDNYQMSTKSFVTVAGERYYEPKTLQATERECRVAAIQLHLMEMGGYATNKFVEDFVKTLRHMADWYIGGSCPLNTPNPKNYTEDNWLWVNTRKNLVSTAYAQFTKEDIQSRWIEVTAWLNQKDRHPALEAELTG